MMAHHGQLPYFIRTEARFRLLTVCLPLLCLVILATSGCRHHGVAEASSRAREVSISELTRIMDREKGYDIGATTNQVRFHSSVLVQLVRSVSRRDSTRRPLLIRPEVWFSSYKKRLDNSAKKMPLATILAYQNRQQIQLDSRPEFVFKNPLTAVPAELQHGIQVQLWWDVEENPAGKFVFIDQNSVPKLEAVNERVITYRILDFGDMLVCDHIQGLRGRPVSGLVSLAFRLIGPVNVVEARFISDNQGGHLMQTTVRKGIFSRRLLLYIDKDGHAKEGIPEKRPDLEVLARRLQDFQKIDF